MSALVVRNARAWSAPEAQPGGLVDLVLDDGVVQGVYPAGPGRAPQMDEAACTGVDVEGRVVTPGWWNCHVHLTEAVWSRGSDDHQLLQRELDDMFLSKGFCSAVDLASDGRSTFALKRRIDAGELRGPRLLTAAEAIRPPLGWPYYTRKEVPWYLWWALPAPFTARAAARVVTSQHRRGAAVTKLFTGSYVTPTRIKVMPRRTSRAAVQVSHSLGMPVFAHPSNAVGLLRAIEAGVDVLAHLPDEAEGTAELLRDAAARGMRLIPTLQMFAATVTTDPAYLDPIDEGLRIYLAAGGVVLFGTDVGYMPERSIVGEVGAMARCGMSPSDILRSLTTAPAALLDEHVGAGTLAPGAPADLTVLDTVGPTVTTDDFANVRCVIRQGNVVYDEVRRVSLEYASTLRGVESLIRGPGVWNAAEGGWSTRRWW